LFLTTTCGIWSRCPKTIITSTLSSNLDIKWDYDFLKKYYDLFGDWHYLCKNKNITWDLIYTILQDDNSIINNISWCPHITINIVKENLDIPWNWRVLSRHPNITIEIIRDNPTMPWNWNDVIMNPNITIEIIRDNPDIPWDLYNLCQSQKCTFEDIDKNKLTKYYWDMLSYNPIITWDIIKNNPGMRWNYEHFSYNPNLTYDNILDNPTINWKFDVVQNSAIMSEIFDVDELTVKLIKRWRAAKIIQKHWFKCITDPEYIICKNRLHKEFLSL